MVAENIMSVSSCTVDHEAEVYVLSDQKRPLRYLKLNEELWQQLWELRRIVSLLPWFHNTMFAVAMRGAAAQIQRSEHERWVASYGPLPAGAPPGASKRTLDVMSALSRMREVAAGAAEFHATTMLPVERDDKLDQRKKARVASADESE